MIWTNLKLDAWAPELPPAVTDLFSLCACVTPTFSWFPWNFVLLLYEGRSQSLLQFNRKRVTKHRCSAPRTAKCWRPSEINNIANNGLLIDTFWSIQAKPWRWFCFFYTFFLPKRKQLEMSTNIDWHGQLQCNHSEMEIAGCCKRNARNKIYGMPRVTFRHHHSTISISYAHLRGEPSDTVNPVTSLSLSFPEVMEGMSTFFFSAECCKGLRSGVSLRTWNMYCYFLHPRFHPKCQQPNLSVSSFSGAKTGQLIILIWHNVARNSRLSYCAVRYS